MARNADSRIFPDLNPPDHFPSMNPHSASPPKTDGCVNTHGLADPGERDLLTRCVHCGLCLEVCPTYQISGEENNSPRGRLRLWREEAEGRLPADDWTVKYTAECVGCLACEPACPANVPYGEILELTRHQHVEQRRASPPAWLRFAAAVAARPRLFGWLATPVRVLRRWGVPAHRFLFRGQPAVAGSTAAYARWCMEKYQPTGPTVALLTGCLMEAVFRELNFATVRVLAKSNVRVVVPAGQGCCGAMHEHLGVGGVEALRSRNQAAFGAGQKAGAATESGGKFDAILANSSGCGLALGKTMRAVSGPPVRDVLEFLGEQFAQRAPAVTKRPAGARVYVDLPCHLVHGQRLPEIPRAVLDATGLDWEYAPMARDCCGSGGVYNLQRPESAREILARKSAFLNEAAGDPVILATSNHVCLMQWHSARSTGLVHKPFETKHIIQLLDEALV